MKNLVVVIVLAFSLCASAQTTFHGNNARDGVYSSQGPTELTGVK